MSLNMTQQAMISIVVKECMDLGISVKLIHKQCILSHGLSCGGYFDSKEKELAVATDSDCWIASLMHEYYHMKQWIEGFKYYTGDEPYTVVGKWLEGSNKYTSLDAQRAAYCVIYKEQDCEKRVISALYTCPDLGVDPVWYTKRTNAAMYFRTLSVQKRKWLIPGKSPFIYKELMPDYLLYPEEYWNIPANIREAMEDCFESPDSTTESAPAS